MAWTTGTYSQANDSDAVDREASRNTNAGVGDHDVIVAEHISGEARIHVEFSNHIGNDVVGGIRHYHVGVKMIGGSPGGITQFKLHGMAV